MGIFHWWFITVPTWGWRESRGDHAAPGFLVVVAGYGFVTLLVSLGALTLAMRFAGLCAKSFTEGFREGIGKTAPSAAVDAELQAARAGVARSLSAYAVQRAGQRLE